MKAIVFHRYGSPDVLELKEIDTPVARDDQVLVRVQAASVNPVDWHRMRGLPNFMRASEGLAKPKNPGLGADVTGWVEAVGGNVTQFQPAGDGRFFASNHGSYAQRALGVTVRAPKVGPPDGETKQR